MSTLFSRVAIVQCRFCGYEPPTDICLPRHGCPKCHHEGWERVIHPAWALTRTTPPDEPVQSPQEPVMEPGLIVDSSLV